MSDGQKGLGLRGREPQKKVETHLCLALALAYHGNWLLAKDSRPLAKRSRILPTMGPSPSHHPPPSVSDRFLPYRVFITRVRRHLLRSCRSRPSPPGAIYKSTIAHELASKEVTSSIQQLSTPVQQHQLNTLVASRLRKKIHCNHDYLRFKRLRQPQRQLQPNNQPI